MRYEINICIGWELMVVINNEGWSGSDMNRKIRENLKRLYGWCGKD